MTTPAPPAGPLPLDQFRIHGVYAQAQPGLFMLRVKIPAARLRSEQARGMAALAQDYGTGILHLTTRMSMEFHGLSEDDVSSVIGQLPDLDLTSRGACGGAVRGVAVSTPLADDDGVTARLARRIQAHFLGGLGKEEFEGLPKKFKVGVNAGYGGARHLIQDAGLVLAGNGDGVPRFDLWIAGGLGREPTPGFRLASRVDEDQAMRLVEATVRIYKRDGLKPKRLKHLRAEIGEEELSARIFELEKTLPLLATPPEAEDMGSTSKHFATAPVFAGELNARTLALLTDLADEYGTGELRLTPEQDIVLPVDGPKSHDLLVASMLDEKLRTNTPREQVAFRICPGSHECKMGLAPTRDVAATVIDALAADGKLPSNLTFAVSGCPNSCAQPQIAGVGISCVRLAKGDDGERTPLYDLWVGGGLHFGDKIIERKPLNKILEAVSELDSLQEKQT